MTGSIRALLMIAIFAGGSACAAGTAAPGETARRNPDLITFEELQGKGQYSNLYDLIEILRPRWLRTRGPDTLMGPPGQVQVHMDGNRLGDVSVLRSLSSAGVTSIRWLDPMDAAARFGLNHSHGAIIISTSVVH